MIPHNPNIHPTPTFILIDYSKSMTKIAVLGAGNIGSYVAANLAAGYDVTVFDNNGFALDNLSSDVSKGMTNLKDQSNVYRVARDSDFVVSALPEKFGYEALMTILEAGKPVVDISFWNQTPARLLQVDQLALNKQVTSFIDCGIAPGFSNAALAFHDYELGNRTRNAKIFVGGIPKDSKRGFYAPWSITGLVEEYTRDALVVANGERIKEKALSRGEYIDSPIGLLEGAVTDGLRSIAYNLDHIPNMAEFTLRYPGHFDQMRLLRSMGFFDDTPLTDSLTANELAQKLLQKAESRDHCKILRKLGFYGASDYRGRTPRDISTEVLRKTWQARPKDKDVLVMRIQADDNRELRATDIYAEHNDTYSAMALTTGGMAALGTRAIIEGRFEYPGTFPLEEAVKLQPSIMEYFASGLRDLGVQYSQSEKPVA